MIINKNLKNLKTIQSASECKSIETPPDEEANFESRDGPVYVKLGKNQTKHTLDFGNSQLSNNFKFSQSRSRSKASKPGSTKSKDKAKLGHNLRDIEKNIAKFDRSNGFNGLDEEDVPEYRGVLKNIRSPGVSYRKHSHHGRESSDQSGTSGLFLGKDKLNPSDTGAGGEHKVMNRGVSLKKENSENGSNPVSGRETNRNLI